MKRVALIIQYDGSGFSGWQRQKNAISVQQMIENALFKVSNKTINTFASGRTDAGVHASGQVVHFDIDFVIPADRYADVLNSRLPQSIRILESIEVKNTWHACYSAVYRHYRYVINNSKIPNLFLKKWSWHRYQKYLDEFSMSMALEGMLGEHDFFAFQKSGSNRSTSVTTIKLIELERKGDLILIDIKATGFLYGMVRAIVGQLVLVGEKKITPETFKDRWIYKNKHDVRESAPAHGLCLINSVYEESIFKSIKKNDLFPKFVISGYS